MQKIICDICGSTIPEKADACPICGASRELTLEAPADTVPEDQENTPETQRKSRFAQVFREEFYDYEETEEALPMLEEAVSSQVSKAKGTNWLVVTLLSIAILAMLAACMFLFFRFYLPYQLKDQQETEPAVTESTLAPVTEETTEPTVPCKSIVLTAGVPEITRIGQYWLLHVMVLPENTTDQLVFISSDENVVTVTDEGRLCAVGEGETTVVISCGMEEILCQVVVKLPEEAVSEEITQKVSEETEAPSETEAPTQQTTAEARGDVVLKLKQSDISFSKKGVTFQLELDCDLKPEEVEWFTMDPDIALCHDGLLTVVGPGTTRIGCRYGDQEVFCIVRCNLG